MVVVEWLRKQADYLCAGWGSYTMKWICLILSFLLSIIAPYLNAIYYKAVMEYHIQNGPSLGLASIAIGIMRLFWCAVLVVVLLIYIITAIRIIKSNRGKKRQKKISKARANIKNALKIIGILLVLFVAFLYACLYFDILTKDYSYHYRWYPDWYQMYAGLCGCAGASLYLLLIFLIRKSKNIKQINQCEQRGNSMNEDFVFPKGGSLIFWGDIFGGRYGENYHQIVDYDFNREQNILRISFDENETCTIHNPENLSFDEKAFIIGDASHIIWEWYYYGCAKEIENLKKIEYIKIDTSTVMKKGFNGCQTKINIEHSALQFL